MNRRLAALLAAMLSSSPALAQRPKVLMRTVDDTLLVVTLGPVSLPAHADHMDISQLGLQTWRMPVGGWLRGYRVAIVDGRGRELPNDLLHHAELVDLDRRDALRPELQRVASLGKETGALLLPKLLGYPVREGQQLGINPMLANATGTSYPEAYVRAFLTITPEGSLFVRSVMSLYAETSYDSTGASDFDLPPGRSTKVVTFTVPVRGRFLGVGGHMHDYGTRFVVVRAGTTDTIYDAVPRRDSSGAVMEMPRRLLLGRSMRVVPGDRFIMTVFYNNPSGHKLEKAGMGTFGMLFLPDNLDEWPKLDRNDPAVQRDLEGLRAPMREMAGMRMND